MRKTLFTFLLFSIFLTSLKSQDAHYSQIFQSPLFLNAALTGHSNGNFRLGGIYRNQWKSVNTPYNSYNFYFDKNNDKFSYGLLVNQNNAGNEGMQTTNFLLSFSLKKQLKEGNNWLSFGSQVGFIQQRFDLSKLTFNNQYNPEKGYDSSLENGENFQKTSILLPDINVGVNWRFSKQSGLPIKGDIGISFAHINTPNSSFLEENIRIPLKSSFYAKAEVDLKRNFGLEPFLIFTKQGTASEFVYGLNSVFKLNESKLKLGIGSRSKDALILMASFSFKNIELGFSYDIHFQEFGSQNTVGSMEFSMIYLFGLKQESEESKLESIHEIRKEQEHLSSSKNDYDADGIPDDLDLCPYETGLKKYQGCNDHDDDGVWDHEDACPILPGTTKNYGCPDQNKNIDSDDDGVIDQYDDCIYVKGLINLSGCPDSDGDGLSDSIDGCPYLKGTKATNGCPTNHDGNSKYQVSNDFIEFDSNASKIKSKYYPFLDRIAFQLKNDKRLKIIIEGHTDEEGNHLFNYHLSQQRAQKVHHYFYEKGVPLDRVEMHFYGETKPKIDEDTDFAKARNRRVELIIIKK